LSNAIDAPPGFDPPVPEFCELMPFQVAGVHYARGRSNSLIGDAPGLGKTIQAIALANLRGCKRVLVVCPANVRPQWQRQIKIWSTLPRVVVYPIYKSSDGVHPTANYVITSFEVARDGLWDTLRSYNWDLLVIDEGHYLKTPDAAQEHARSLVLLNKVSAATQELVALLNEQNRSSRSQELHYQTVPASATLWLTPLIPAQSTG
jgi:SNF2 family DNA or RNA helicase